MNIIDHMGAFTDEATAQADPTWGAYYTPPSGEHPGSWRLDVCLPGVLVFDPAQDVTEGEPPATTHTPYDDKWRIIIGLPAQDEALSASPACELVADRDAAARGDPHILKSTFTQAELDVLHAEPQFFGMEVYPFGEP